MTVCPKPISHHLPAATEESHDVTVRTAYLGPYIRAYEFTMRKRRVSHLTIACEEIWKSSSELGVASRSVCHSCGKGDPIRSDCVGARAVHDAGTQRDELVAAASLSSNQEENDESENCILTLNLRV